MKKNHKDITKKISSGAAACLLGCTFVMAPMNVGAEEVEPIMGMERTIESSLKTGFKGVSFKGIGNNKVLLSGRLENADKEKFKIYLCEKTEVNEKTRDLNLDDESEKYRIIKEVESEQDEGDLKFWLHLDPHDKENIKDDAEYALLAKDNENAEIIVSDDVDGEELKELFEVGINKEVLSTLIGESITVKTELKYLNETKEHRDAYDAAIEVGQAVLDKEDATQEEVDSAVEKITTAKADLNGKEIDKTVLRAKIEECKKLKETYKYQNASLEKRLALDNAIQEGLSVIYEADSTNEDIDKAVKNLEKAAEALDGQEVDLSELKQLVSEYDTVKGTKEYADADERKDPYDKAIYAGSLLLTNSNRNQEDIDLAVKEIIKTWDAFNNEIRINKAIKGDENVTINLVSKTEGKRIVLTIYGKEVKSYSVEVKGDTVSVPVLKLEKGDKLKAQLIDANGEVIDTNFAK